MQIATDLQARLAPLGVDVLLPEDIDAPTRGGLPNQPTGLTAFLATRPAGYVQLYDDAGTFATLNVGHGLVTLDVVAPDRAAAQALADRVVRALHGVPARPTPYALLTPARVQPITGRAVRATLQFQSTAIHPL